MYTEEEIETQKRKAQKWDELEEKIAVCYGRENEDGEWEENNDENIDLCTIGEIAASAFEWL
ncbi:hypothetical protein [Chitinophaga sp. MM2321]|uniref:hypothetical protein n=1 Tax=Chitinophaga sp. MM2321 TaxID=3137178 RepID=UPI0032D597D3